MKNIVSFETAKALKDAGFPQPEPEAGQFWYLEELDLSGSVYRTGVLFVFVRAWNGFLNGVFFAVNEYTQQRGRDFAHNPFFAPTATDILGQIKEHVNLSQTTDEKWMCYFQAAEITPGLFIASNSAEAAAAAWLAIKKDLEV